jgi:hypothetical protein
MGEIPANPGNDGNNNDVAGQQEDFNTPPPLPPPPPLPELPQEDPVEVLAEDGVNGASGGKKFSLYSA